MMKKSAATADASCAGPLTIFESVATGFLRTLASGDETGDVATYLDGADTVDGAFYPRRAVVLVVEELKQQTEAPARGRRT